MAALNDGLFVVAYQATQEMSSSSMDSGSSLRQERIFVQMVQNDGQLIGSEISANSFRTADRQETVPAIAAIQGDNGGFAVSWIETALDVNGTQGTPALMMRLFAPDGSQRTPAYQINQLNETVGKMQTMAALDDGRLILAWSARPLTSSCSSNSISGQLLDENGRLIGSQFQINDNSPYDQYDPAVSNLNGGRFVVTWTSTMSDSTTMIRAQLFDDRGTRDGPAFYVNQNISQFQSTSVISERYDGGFLVLWSSFDLDGNNLGIFGQLFDYQGQLLGSQFQASDSTQGSQYLPSAIVFPNNEIVLTWTDKGTAIAGRLLTCEQNCTLSDWSTWSPCSKSCGGGTRIRTRSAVFPPLADGDPCDSPHEEQEPCNTQSCVADSICTYCYLDQCYTLLMTPMTHQEGMEACSKLSGCPSGAKCMARVEGQQDRTYIVNNVAQGHDVWIASWQGLNYGDKCLGISAFGAVIVPLGGCLEQRMVVCQVPRPLSCPASDAS